ncbi:MAG TPA: PilT/PilU family type 4a pilus ATPase [Chthoniobacterales bacterium]
MNKELLDHILAAMIDTDDGVSDLLFVVGKPPHVELHGHLHAMETDPPGLGLTHPQITAMGKILMNGNKRLEDDYLINGSCDCSYAIPEARFRVNFFRQNNNPAIVMRKLNSAIPTMQKLNLPPVFKNIIKEKNGIIFVTGGTGSGKTTTLAAMLNEINENQSCHIITLEDPIEFLHPHKKSIFCQRELGKDYNTFPNGLRAALRQAPKVILVGEIRDRETMEIAMTAAETGHVVFSTLHTINAGQTINRILGMFTREEEPLIRQRLAETLRYVISQRLVTKIEGGRHLITEIMGSSLSTREAMLYGEKDGRTFQDIIEAAVPQGWHSFDQELLHAVENGIVTEESAMLYCNIKNKMSRELDSLRNQRGSKDASFQESGLRIQQEPKPAPAPPAAPAGAPVPEKLGLQPLTTGRING